MVQVDVFWSYALGAGFAAAAMRQITKRPPEENGGFLENRYFVAAVLFLAILFAPSGICLLWAFPSWETMHAGDRSLPAWLVTLFAVTNITQGMLGFWVTTKLIRAGKKYLASLQMVLGYFCMFFILVHGWDGTGYKRFFSATNELFASWSLWNIPGFFVSEVGITLYILGVFLIPPLMYLMSSWVLAGARESGVVETSTVWGLSGKILTVILGATLGLAICASLLVHILGWILGAVVFVVAAWFLTLRKGALLHRMTSAMLLYKEGID